MTQLCHYHIDIESSYERITPVIHPTNSDQAGHRRCRQHWPTNAEQWADHCLRLVRRRLGLELAPDSRRIRPCTSAYRTHDGSNVQALQAGHRSTFHRLASLQNHTSAHLTSRTTLGNASGWRPPIRVAGPSPSVFPTSELLETASNAPRGLPSQSELGVDSSPEPTLSMMITPGNRAARSVRRCGSENMDRSASREHLSSIRRTNQPRVPRSPPPRPVEAAVEQQRLPGSVEHRPVIRPFLSLLCFLPHPLGELLDRLVPPRSAANDPVIGDSPPILVAGLGGATRRSVRGFVRGQVGLG